MFLLKLSDQLLLFHALSGLLLLPVENGGNTFMTYRSKLRLEVKDFLDAGWVLTGKEIIMGEERENGVVVLEKWKRMKN